MAVCEADPGGGGVCGVEEVGGAGGGAEGCRPSEWEAPYMCIVSPVDLQSDLIKLSPAPLQID